MLTIRYNRRALCAGDDIQNGIYDIALPEDAVLRDLIGVLLRGGNGNGWPIPHNHDGWLIFSNIGALAHVSGDLKRVEYCADAGAKLAALGLRWVFGEYEGEDPKKTAFTCRSLFRDGQNGSTER